MTNQPKTTRKPSHIVFDGEKIIISPSIRETFDFLIEIEKEVKSFLDRESQLERIRKQLSEFVGLTQEMARIIEEADLDFNFQISEEPKTIVDKLKFNHSPRSEFIVLFAQLETMRCLWTAYSQKTNDKKKLRVASDKEIDLFFEDFCLCKENRWVKNNPKRAGKIGIKNLRGLRNSLTHFFSVSKLAIAPPDSEKDIEYISDKTNNKVQAMTTKDLLEISKGVFEILMQGWSENYQKSLKDENSDFEERIECVNKLVKNHGAKILYRNN